MIQLSVLAFLLSTACTVFAAGAGGQADDLDRQLAQLAPTTFHPNLLPVILRNADMIGLSASQVADLRAWRAKYARPMVAAMREVAKARIAFQTAALASTTSDETLRKFQNQIFAMQRKVLDYKLACRDNIARSFTQENWENLYLALAVEGSTIPIPAYGERVVALPGSP
jgi:hypothetical protein